MSNYSINLYNVQGIARLSGNDEKDGTSGCQWIQSFYGEMEDSAIESFYMAAWEDGIDANKAEQQAMRGKWKSHMPECCICHKHINSDAWLNLDGGDMACDKHVRVVTRA